MTKPNSTDITVILDRSGSMGSIASDMCGGFDSFVRKQRQLPGECTISLVQFDTVRETVYSAVPIHDVPPLVLVPRGSTALHDAIGHTINETGRRLRALPEHLRPAQVLLMIISDGHENASSEFAGSTIEQMTKHQREKYQWEFMYLGANQDAVVVAKSLGIVHNAFEYEAKTSGAIGSFNAASAGVACYRSAGVPLMQNIVTQESYAAAVVAVELGAGQVATPNGTVNVPILTNTP